LPVLRVLESVVRHQASLGIFLRNWLINTESKDLDYYKGILIHADTGVHEQAAKLFNKYVPLQSRVLDVGAGAGAFSQRLTDLNYNVTALDSDPDKWIPTEIPFFQLDIDAGIAASVRDTFDAVSCLEVIEHVENPWNLLREIYNVVKPGGYVLLSTPNITSFLSRGIFFLTGRFHQFDDGDLSYGHISPISAFELEYAARKSGWNVLEIVPGGSLSVFDFTSLRPVKWTIALNFLRGMAYLIGKGHHQGWCLFYVLQKPE
jgi:2-polyprenyl-3-methyl-5-hydroxy-6-metoxy-1,4-benzoquinol methylase